MTRERDELDRQAREHLRKIDELRLEAGDRDKTATETKDELLVRAVLPTLLLTLSFRMACPRLSPRLFFIHGLSSLHSRFIFIFIT